MNRPIPKLTDSDLTRYWAKVDKAGPDDCWEWAAGKVQNGYGKFWLNGFSFQANRIVYFIEHEVDPNDKQVCHSCDNPGCCNPKHLWLGTDQDNTDDCKQKGRDARGSKKGNAKLTEREVREILESRETNRALAKRYGIANQGISEIRRGDGWTHAEGSRHSSKLQINNKTGVHGVSFNKTTGRYVAKVQFEKKKYHVGYFDTVAEAEQALIAKRAKLGIKPKE